MKKVSCLILFLLAICLSGGCDANNEINNSKENEIDHQVIVPAEDSPTKATEVKWPSNEYTAQIPEFTYGTNGSVYSNESDGFVYNAYEVSLEEYKMYIKALKKQGVKKDISESDYQYYSYVANNSTYQVALSYIDGYITLTVIKL